jgi:hypothetical protein
VDRWLPQRKENSFQYVEVEKTVGARPYLVHTRHVSL